MKKMVPILLLLLVPAFLFGQDILQESRHYLARLGVQNGEITKVIDLQMSTRRQIREAQLQLNVLKADLERALFPTNVDMHAVRNLLDQSLQWKMKAELAAIQERVELRKMLGDYRYAEYIRFFHNAMRRVYGRPNRPPNGARNR